MRHGLTLTALSAVLAAIGGVVAANIFDRVDPTVVNQYRTVIAAVVLAGAAYRQRMTMTGGRLPLLGVFGAVIAGVTITFYWSIERLGVGPGVMLQFTAPVLVLIWMRFVQGRNVPGSTWLAALTAVGGVVAVVGTWGSTAFDPIGLAAGLASMVFYASYLLIGEYLSARLPVLATIAYGFAVSALIWVVVIPPTIVSATPIVWFQLLWIGVMGTAVPFLLVIQALSTVDSGRVGVVATLEPVVAAAAAWLVLGQTLSGAQILGGILVVTAIVFVQQGLEPSVPTTQ